MKIELTDTVIRLQMLEAADAPVHLAGDDALAQRYLSGGLSTLDTVSAWIERCRLSWERGGPVRCLAIRTAARDVLVGYIEANLDHPAYRPGVANISYGLYPRARGHGYATRAVRLILDDLRRRTAARAAVIQVEPANHASLHVALRAGFRHLGERLTTDGKRLVVFALPLGPATGDLRLEDVRRE